MTRRRGAALGAAALVSALAPAALADDAVPSPAVELALPATGHVGAFVVLGPFEHARAPHEERLSPHLGDGWRLASTATGALDVAAALERRGGDLFAYAGGVLRVAQAGRHTLLVGADDGLAVYVDGVKLCARDERRAMHEDQELLPVDLTAGDHAVVLALHRRGTPWSVSLRVLDAALEAPRGASWVLPGAGADDARGLAERMSTLSLDRGLTAAGYRPTLTVRFLAGAPRDVRLDVHARVAPAGGGPALFDVSAGEAALGDRGVQELTVSLPELAGGEVEDQDWTVRVDVAGHPAELPWAPRRAVREALTHASEALAKRPDESVAFLRERLAGFAARGDTDTDAQAEDARELSALSDALAAGSDPWAERTGPMRRAFRSPLDGRPSEVAVYAPPDLDPSKRYPLIVALHGMNGRAMEMLMWLFGHDEPQRDGIWEDRHPRRELERLEAIVVAPTGHFNATYRDLGEEDVMEAVDWAMAHYPVDEARVSITGPSMGGIGTAACALHHPGRFAAAAPLCGYHSYFVRGDIGGRSMRPWERFVAEERSNSFWAENGLLIPMFVVHGRRDLPEENSGVLIDRYAELRYAMKHEHPDLGHNVWQSTYEDLRGAHWLMWHKRPLHPRGLRFKTPSSRWADDAWLHVREMTASDAWGEIFARIDDGNAVKLTTRGIDALALDRDAERMDDSAPVTVTADGARVTFQPGEPLELHREAGAWAGGPAMHPGLHKHGSVTGPLRDVLHDPLLFVWGAGDPSQARANEETARAWARVKPGVHVDYPVMSDAEFLAKGEPLANDRALFLVGNAASNRLVRELEPSLPLRVDGDAIVLGARRVAATDGPAERSQLGAAFICPNPRRPDRYVVVVEGVGALGTWRSQSLPDMLPDWVVFDAGVAPARGQLILGSATVRAAGLFTNDWAVPPPGDAADAASPSPGR